MNKYTVIFLRANLKTRKKLIYDRHIMFMLASSDKPDMASINFSLNSISVTNL